MLVDLRPKEINGKERRKFSIVPDYREQKRHSIRHLPIFKPGGIRVVPRP